MQICSYRGGASQYQSTTMSGFIRALRPLVLYVAWGLLRRDEVICPATRASSPQTAPILFQAGGPRSAFLPLDAHLLPPFR